MADRQADHQRFEIFYVKTMIDHLHEGPSNEVPSARFEEALRAAAAGREGWSVVRLKKARRMTLLALHSGTFSYVAVQRSRDGRMEMEFSCPQVAFRTLDRWDAAFVGRLLDWMPRQADTVPLSTCGSRAEKTLKSLTVKKEYDTAAYVTLSWLFHVVATMEIEKYSFQDEDSSKIDFFYSLTKSVQGVIIIDLDRWEEILPRIPHIVEKSRKIASYKKVSALILGSR